MVLHEQIVHTNKIKSERIKKKHVFGVYDRLDTNRAAKPQKMVRGLKFRILEGDGLYMSTYNNGFYEDLTKIIFQLSSNMHFISSSVLVKEYLLQTCNSTDEIRIAGMSKRPLTSYPAPPFLFKI